jgi:heme/copper-type cytochrome/quinol oxidase subunit 2
LCGWGHYKMKARATFEPRTKYNAWLADKFAEQHEQRAPAVVESDD